jgi:hypothetical protein
MGEIYKEAMATRGDQEPDIAYIGAVWKATDEKRFTYEQILANLREISELAKRDNIDTSFSDIMLEVNLRKGE